MFKSNKFLSSVIAFSFISTLLSAVTFVNPLGNAFKSSDNGGTLSAIDAYKDGVGAVVIDNLMTVDNSVMNGLVYKYGDAAKTAGVTVVDQVLYGTGTAADKVLAGKLTTNGSTCNDNNPATTGETWLNGVCQGGINNNGTSCDDLNSFTYNDIYTNGICAGVTNGTTCSDGNAATYGDIYTNGVCSGYTNGTSCDDGNSATINDIYTNGICAGSLSTASVGDIFGDNSAKSLYSFENNLIDTLGTYNATGSNITYGTGKYGLDAIFSGTSYINFGTKFFGNDYRTAYSVSLWFKSKSSGNSNYVPILSQGNAGMGGGCSYLTINPSNQLAWGEGDQSISWGYATDTSGIIALNTWYHVVIVKSNTGLTKVYKNGVHVGSITPSQGTADAGNTALGYWAYNPSNPYKFVGEIDNVRFFNKTLSPTEVTQLFNEE